MNVEKRVVFQKYVAVTMLFIALITLGSFVLLHERKPILFIIGDSTVKNGSGTGANKQWGWGSFLDGFFDTTKITVQNHAIGGRSSRTFISDGRWDKIMQELHPGDFVIMQFGHNDSSPLDDTARARGTIKGIGDESQEIYNPIRKTKEMVYTYGWYMRKYIDDTKSKGAIPIICSPVPRNSWKDGKINRATSDYGKWASEIAASNKAWFIDLNNLIADQYESLGETKVIGFFPADHTHTNEEGAKLNAAKVVEGLQKLKDCPLNKYLLSSGK